MRQSPGFRFRTGETVIDWMKRFAGRNSAENEISDRKSSERKKMPHAPAADKERNGERFMRILVISDTHGHEDNLERVLMKEGKPDHVLHLGDIEGGEDSIRQMVGCPLDVVSGNCDFFSRMPKVKFVEIGGYKIMMTHGHYYYVTVGTRDLVEEAKTNGCNVVMFGHTHKPMLNEEDEELTVLNPGSLSFPRQEGRRPSYIMMEIGTDGKAHYEIHYLS